MMERENIFFDFSNLFILSILFYANPLILTSDPIGWIRIREKLDIQK